MVESFKKIVSLDLVQKILYFLYRINNKNNMVENSEKILKNTLVY